MEKQILIVEDDPDTQDFIAHIVEHMNMRCVVTNSAEEAEALLADVSQVFQMIFIDLSLPGKSGWELLEQIRSKGHTKQATCVAFTAYHSSKVRVRALERGFDGYLTKPVDAQQLANLIESFVAD